MAIVRLYDGTVLVGQAADEYNRAIRKAMEDPEMVKLDPLYFHRIREYCKNVSLDGVSWHDRNKDEEIEDQTHPWED